MENERRAKVGYDESYGRESFGISGPVHLTSIDWNSIYDRKSVAASLVNGVYVLESDRHNIRVGSKALSTPWWSFFQFQLIETLVDKDNTYFGAIFEYKATRYQPSHGNNYHTPRHNSVHKPPRYVLAFRGTVKKIENLIRDLKLDARLALNRSLARDIRYQIAINALKRYVSVAGPSSVWLAGHSLGAGIALQVGKAMAKLGSRIDTYLFNPPYPSPPLEMLENENAKNAIRVTKNLVTARLCHYLHPQCSVQHASFVALCPWIPYIFVHQKDPISSEYIGYFDQRRVMELMGLGDVGNVATKSSVLGLVLGALGRDPEDTHLIPSAYVTKNMRWDMTLNQAHGIQQWWQQSCVCHSQLHQIKP